MNLRRTPTVPSEHERRGVATIRTFTTWLACSVVILGACGGSPRASAPVTSPTAVTSPTIETTMPSTTTTTTGVPVKATFASTTATVTPLDVLHFGQIGPQWATDAGYTNPYGTDEVFVWTTLQARGQTDSVGRDAPFSWTDIGNSLGAIHLTAAGPCHQDGFFPDGEYCYTVKGKPYYVSFSCSAVDMDTHQTIDDSFDSGTLGATQTATAYIICDSADLHLKNVGQGVGLAAYDILGEAKAGYVSVMPISKPVHRP